MHTEIRQEIRQEDSKEDPTDIECPRTGLWVSGTGGVGRNSAISLRPGVGRVLDDVVGHDDAPMHSPWYDMVRDPPHDAAALFATSGCGQDAAANLLVRDGGRRGGVRHRASCRADALDAYP